MTATPGWGSGGACRGLLAGTLAAGLLAARSGLLAGAVAGSVCVLHPFPAFLSARVMGDEFQGAAGFVALLCWWRALSSERGRSARSWTAAAGALLAVHMMTRSSGLLTMAAALGFALARRPRRAGLCAILAAIALGPPLAWSVRSSLLEGRPVFVHSMTAHAFWVGEAFDRLPPQEDSGRAWARAQTIVLERAGIEGAEARQLWYAELTPPRAAEVDGTLARAASERVAREPASYLARWVRGLGRFWYAAQTRGRSAQYLAAIIPVLALAAAGAAASMRRGREDPFAVLLLVAVALHKVAYAAILPMARMSVQVFPAVGYLAGAGAARAAELLRGRGGLGSG